MKVPFFECKLISQIYFAKYTQMRVSITKVSSSNLNTGMCVKLHTNARNYQISRFYTCAIAHILRILSMNTTSILHPFYAHRDAAITLTSAAPRRNTWQVGQSMVNYEKALHILYHNIKWSTQSIQDTCHAQWEGWV